MSGRFGQVALDAKTPKSFWSYQASEPTPRVEDLPAGAFKGTQAQWEQLSPGMRREIARQAKRAGAKDTDFLATDPPVSEKQRRAMFAAKNGKSTLGIPKKVGEEFIGKDANLRDLATKLQAMNKKIDAARQSGDQKKLASLMSKRKQMLDNMVMGKDAEDFFGRDMRAKLSGVETKGQLDTIIEYVRDKKSVDIIKLADKFNISVGAANRVNEVRKEIARSNAASPTQSKGERLAKGLRENKTLGPNWRR